jgi:hypothetical protein
MRPVFRFNGLLSRSAVRGSFGVASRKSWGLSLGAALQGQGKDQRRGLLTESYSIGPVSVRLLFPFPLCFIYRLKLRRLAQPPLLPHTIPQHFTEVVSSHGDRTAVISRSQKTRLSYRELDERSNVIAAGLRERGVAKGDRVAVSLGNCWEFAVVTYSLFKLGAILVSLTIKLLN